MKNEHSLIGLFKGMFENHILTFNLGWDESANQIEFLMMLEQFRNNSKAKV